MRAYTGVGSRRTPSNVLTRMTEMARERSEAGWTLRSGGSWGADEAFERGAGERKEIWLPWPGWRGHKSPLFPSLEAFRMAARIHPAWERCNQMSRKFHARNCHAVLGEDLKSPSEEIVCWTPGGEVVGGTATAIRIAQEWGIRVTNLGSRR